QYTGQPGESYTVGDNTYTPEDIGALTIKLEPKSKISPYIGLGIGNPVGGGGRVKFYIDIGALYSGQGDVTLTAEEGTMIYPTTRQDNIIEDNISNLKWYPVLSLGLSIKLM
ncbi:hypothetical protein BVY01_01910, partial [bacterium I07]